MRHHPTIHKSVAQHKPLPLKSRPFKGVDNTRDIDRIVERSKLFQDVIGCSNENVTHLFEQAVGMLHQRMYDEAIRSFTMLTTINPFVSDFWIGLGMAHEAEGRWEQALSAHLTAQTMDPTRLDSYDHAMNCCLELKHYEQIRQLLAQGVGLCKRHSKQEAAHELLKELLRLQEQLELARK